MTKSNDLELNSEVKRVLEQIGQMVKGSLKEVFSLRDTIKYKEDGSPVTDADLMLESRIVEILVQGLGPVRIVGEESGDSGTRESHLTALIDPIDGTENFCSGLPEWGVSVGLWNSGKHVGSTIILPELNRSLISGGVIQRVPYSRITGFSSSRAKGVISQLESAVEYRISGCAVYNLYSVITGSFCKFANSVGAYAWDVLPGLCLALENNCEVQINGLDFDGQLVETSGRHSFDVRHRYDSDSR